VRLLVLAILPALAACEPHAKSSGAAPAASSAAVPPPAPARPYTTHVPPGLDRSHPAPLVVWLHGYGETRGEAYARALGLEALADEQGFLLALPDGTPDARGNRFWNATDACCDFEHQGGDDVAYLGWVISDASRAHAVDPDRVYVAGHSNGGFMALRLACDLAPRIAGAVSFAGAGWKDPSRCHPSEPVSVLQISGDADAVIRRQGGRVFDQPMAEYPSTQETIASWLQKDGCGAGAQPALAPIDLDQTLPGAETTRVSYPACRDGVAVDLWTVAGGTHIPHPTHAGLEAIWAWMAAHPKHRR
jgi:polyhydroxybutyrate depolymerase